MKARGGFSLIEILIAIVVLCLLATVLGPQLGSAASDARTASLCESLQNVRRHIEVYRRHHEDCLPVSSYESGEDFVHRIAEVGDPGQRLERMPSNPFNRLDTVRVGGPDAGAGTHGWRFDPITGAFQADDRDARDAQPLHANL